MALYRLYLKTPDIEILVAEKREDLQLIADDEKGLPLFTAKELGRVIEHCHDPREFRVICAAKTTFGGRVKSVTRKEGDS